MEQRLFRPSNSVTCIGPSSAIVPEATFSSQSPSEAGHSTGMTQRRFLAGAGKIVDGQVPYFDSKDHWVDINNRGEVAYTGVLPTRDRGVFINEQMVVAPGDVIDGYTLERIGEQARINDLGTVVFETGRMVFDNAISSQHHIVLEAGLVDDSVRVTGVAWPHINDGGDIAVIANIRQLDSSGIANQEEILFKKGDVIDGLTVFKVRGFGGITDDGEVVAHLHLVLDENNDVGTMIATQNRVLCRGPCDHVYGRGKLDFRADHVVCGGNGQCSGWRLRQQPPRLRSAGRGGH